MFCWTKETKISRGDENFVREKIKSDIVLSDKVKF